jgi:hypothetical protein
MKITSTVDNGIASLPHPILPAVQGEPDCHTIHAIRKLLQANTVSIDTHMGGGDLGHLDLIVSAASYAVVSANVAWTDPEIHDVGQPSLRAQLSFR